MKKIITSIIMMALLPVLTSAHDAEIDGIYYNFSGDEATVTHKNTNYNSYSGSVAIPESVTYNGKTFSVTSIGDYAFCDCSDLTSVTIPEGVTNFGNYSFAGCSNMTGITIPKSVTSIGNRAFLSCYFKRSAFVNNSDLKSSDNWGAKLYDYETDDGLLISGSVIVLCRYWATSVTIPQGITSIGDGAFSGCTSLTSVTIPEGVRTIGVMAFRYCTSLTSITIPRSVTSISDYAFNDCTSLTAVYITDLSAWCRIQFWAGGNPLSFAGHLFLNGEEITELVIPDNVTEISALAFLEWTGLTSVTIPNNVTSIAPNAFYGCSGLTSVSIGSGVTSIGKDAFYKCNGLEKAEFASIASLCRISFYNINANPLCKAHHLYVDGSEVTELVIPDGVTSIGDYTFYGCSSLTSISFPGSLTSIGNSSFYQCNGLTDIYCNAENVPEIQDNTFYGVNKSGVFLHVPEGTVDKYKAATSWRSFKIIEIGVEEGIVIDGINYRIYTAVHSKALTADVMAGNNEESEIVIPSTFEYEGETYRVTSIGNSAFSNCRTLTSITIPDGVTSIGESAFLKCSSLTSVTLGNGLTSIGNNAFSGCSGLTSIIIPDGVTSIGEGTFYDCLGLTSVTLGNGLTSIGNNAFRNCGGLTSIIILEGVTSIGNSAFYRCSGLTSITIPSSVTSIGSSAFGYCRGLTDVYCLAEDIPSTTSNPFNTSNISSATLHVPAASLEAYKATSPWSGFGTIVALADEDGIQEIKNEELRVKNEGDWYSFDGKKLCKPQKGINIVRHYEGTTRKVLVK